MPGEEVFHDNLVGRGHARTFKDDAQPGEGTASRGIPDLDQPVGASGDAEVLVAALDGDHVELAELVKFLGLHHITNELGRDQLGYALLIGGGVYRDRLVRGGLGRALALDDAKDLGLDETGVTGSQRGAGDDELRKRRRQATTSCANVLASCWSFSIQ